MRIFALTTAFCWAAISFIHAQCDLTALQVINTLGQVLVADEECTDADGWTHYYNTASNKIILSIQKNGQDIGSIDLGMIVKSGTLPSFGSGVAYNLSGADYIDNEIWVVTNRYWQVTGANAIAAPVQVRFYFSNTDVADIAASVDDFGFIVDEPKDLYMYTISNAGGLYPLATSTQPFNASYTLYDMFVGGPPEWADGDFNGFPYGEFAATSLDNGGGAGFLIFQSSPTLTISGNIARPNGDPVPDVTVQAAAISTSVTDANGDYSCASLLSGSNYDVVPNKDINHAEGITVLDLIAIHSHVIGSQPLTTPYQIIAANAYADTIVTFYDLANVRDVLLGNASSFPNNTSWRFVREGYTFPSVNSPLTMPYPEQITAFNLQDSLDNQDFIGVKIGDVADPSTANPPALNTTFSLPSLNACNPGDTVVFDLMVQDFQNVRGFQFTVEWDETVLDFLAVSNFSLTSFNINSVGDDAADSGALTFAWFNQQNANGSTLPNGSVICKLRFIATGSIGSGTPLSFTGSATDLLLVHQNLTQVVPSTVSGSFIIDNNSAVSATAFVQTASCTGSATGAIDLTTTGGAQPLNYAWNNGATTQDIFGLVAGQYTVTITDASGSCPLVLSYEVTPPVAMNLSATVSDMSCPFVVDGSIELHVAGGEAPFTYQWSDGSTTRINEDLYEGTYSVTVTDGAGCTSTASFDVGNAPQLVPVVMVTNASNANKNDGSVVISAINGGTGPFSFLWNNGATTQSIEDVLPGDYVVTITDAAGCQHVFGYEVYGLFTGTVEAGSSLEAVEAYPNPVLAGGIINFVFSVKKAGNLRATVVAADGKIVAKQQFELPIGQSIQQAPAPVASGFYIVHFEMDGFPAGHLKLVVH